MPLLVIGINHNTAPVELREKVAFSADALDVAYASLNDVPHVISAMILSTCNRTELYVESSSECSDAIIDWLVSFHELDMSSLLPSLYSYKEDQAITHLMRVACGLDSLVLGEPQILGQVKQVYSQAIEHSALDGTLDKLLQKTFSVAKRVRTETEIGSSAVSVAYAACNLAKHIFESLADASILLVGAGETIELVAKHLHDSGGRKMAVANRTKERAQGLADNFGARAMSLSDIPNHLMNVDIVISSTASQLPIIGKGMVEDALKARRHKPMLFIDIAVPRDIESQVADLNDAYLYTVDDLQSIIDKNMQQRRSEAVRAEAIVKEECASFMEWRHSRLAVDSIRDYRLSANDVRVELLAKSLSALQSGAAPEKVLVELSNKLTNRLIHEPTKALQTAAQSQQFDKLGVIRQTLGLDDN